jgi:hypothetical protein
VYRVEYDRRHPEQAETRTANSRTQARRQREKVRLLRAVDGLTPEQIRLLAGPPKGQSLLGLAADLVAARFSLTVE